MQRTKLIIYIPTYNRPGLLLEQLQVLAADIQNGDEIQVFVQNNCSKSDYGQIKSYCEKPHFHYSETLVNIDGMPNIANGMYHVHHANYFWILSDDDILNPGVLKSIYNHLRNNEIDMYFLDGTMFHAGIQVREVESREALDLVAHGLGLVSTQILNCKFATRYIWHYFHNYHNYFPHVSLILEGLRQEGSIRVGFLSQKDCFKKIGGVYETDIKKEADYTHAFLGYVFLAKHLTPNLAKKHCWGWLTKNWYTWMRVGRQRPDYFYLSKYYFKAYIPCFEGVYLILLMMYPFRILFRGLRKMTKV